MSHPYETLPSKAFWKSAVASVNSFEISELWTPKYTISKSDRVITFGSCFAQHISRALRSVGYSWYDAEPGPQILGSSILNKFNYGIFSARTGNIYTTKLLRQWVEWAFDVSAPPRGIWRHNNRVFDPFRPAIEPDGFLSRKELLSSRRVTLDALRSAFETANLFVFTLGLTESWEDKEDGFCYAACPGTIAGKFDATEHIFRNYGYEEVVRDLEASLSIIRHHNPKLRVLLTVSPVPLTATAEPKHVLVSTTYSKSVLRAAAGAVAEKDSGIDYFPSYEIITAPPFGGMFYDPNMRTISKRGVAHVMEHFMAGLQSEPENFLEAEHLDEASSEMAAVADDEEDVKCEEVMLESFVPKSLSAS